MREDFIRAGSLLQRTSNGGAMSLQGHDRKFLAGELAVILFITESAKFMVSDITVIGEKHPTAIYLMTMDGSAFVYTRASFFLFWRVVDE